jgi:hypothetical protein
MELDKVLGFATILAWEDLSKATEPCSARIEYRCNPGKPLDYVGIWATSRTGHQDLVCGYSCWFSPGHPIGPSFANGYYSKKLAESLDFIMKNQKQFSRRSDECRDGLILISPPTDAEHVEAANCMRGFCGATTNADSAINEKSLL